MAAAMGKLPLHLLEALAQEFARQIGLFLRNHHLKNVLCLKAEIYMHMSSEYLPKFAHSS